MAAELPCELRLSRLTVNSLRNLCDTHYVQGASNLLKDELVEFVKKSFNKKTLEDFCRAQEEIYLVENMAKAIKWSASRKIVSVDPDSDYTIVNAVFTSLAVTIGRQHTLERDTHGVYQVRSDALREGAQSSGGARDGQGTQDVTQPVAPTNSGRRAPCGGWRLPRSAKRAGCYLQSIQ